MPINNGKYIKLTEDEIYDRLETNLEDKLGVTAEPGDLIKQQLEAEAETLAQNQEEALERVYYATYLEDAEGKELDKIVDLIGLSRQEATSATGTAKFSRDTPPNSDYPIPRGAEIQTGGSSPLEFETTEQSRLYFIDGFEAENLDNWRGDKAGFSITSTNTITDLYSLKKSATSGVTIKTADRYKIGTTFDFELNPESGAIVGFQFGRDDSLNYYEAVIDTSGNDLTLQQVVDGSVANTVTESVTIPTGQTSHVEVQWQLYGDSVLRLYQTDSKDTEIGSAFLDDSKEWNEGHIGIRSGDSTATALLDDFSTTATVLNIEAVDAGIETNIAPNQITTFSDDISGVETVTNTVATGDDKNQNRDFRPFITGEDVETDEELRERAFDNTSIGGAATTTAIATKIDELEGVQSVKLFKNKTEDPKDGLPSHSFEPVVYGGEDKEIANAIFGTMSIDSTDFGGAHGVETSYTVNSDVLGQSETIHWSRPYKKDLNITLDLIVDDTYIGDTEVRTLLVEYIGGTNVDGSFVPGLAAGEDVYEAVLKQNIVAPLDTGVWEVDSLTIDKNGDSTDDTETAASGAEILAVSDSEIAQVNARDGSITINTTQK